MLDSAIRELAASRNPPRLAAALFESTVQIWDLTTRDKMSEFSTVFCFGAANLSLSPEAGILVAGASKSRGKVAAYEVPSGRKIWEREIVYPSRLRFHSAGEFILCSSNRESVFRLDAHTGTVLDVIKGIAKHIEGPYGDSLSVPANKNGPFRLVARKRVFDLNRASFALLDAQFSPDSVCVSEASGPVRCFSCDSGTLQWTFDPGAHKHVLRLRYSPKMNAFFGVLYDLNSKDPRHLLRFDATNGTCEPVYSFDSWGEVFLDAMDQLVTSKGAIIDLSSGACVGELSFPQKEYPDD